MIQNRLHTSRGNPLAVLRQKEMLTAAATLAIFLLIWWQAGLLYHDRLLEDHRVQISNELRPYSNNLTLALNQRIALLEGLAAFVETCATAGELDAGFEQFATGLHATTEGIRVFQFFPREGPVYVYPQEGNEATLGRTLQDLINDERPGVATDVNRAIQTRDIALSGPYELRQGGLGLVARKPVFDGETLSGIAVVILDIPPLLTGTHLDDSLLGISAALSDGTGQVFFGSNAVLDDDPVTYPIVLPDGEWSLAAIPLGGWNRGVRSEIREFQVVGLVIGSLLALLAYQIITRSARLTEAVRQQTESLEISQARYEQLFTQNANALFVMDQQGTILDANQTVCDNYGYMRDELIGMNVTNLAPPDLQPEVPEWLHQVLLKRVLFQWRHMRKDGSEFPVEISACPITLEGKPAVLSDVRDITEQTEAVEALRASEERFRALVEQSLTGIYILHTDRFAYVNRRFAEMFGYTEEEILNTLRPTDVIAPEDRAEAANNINRRLSGEVKSIHYQARGLRKDGALLWLDIHGSSIELDGEPTIAGTILDITDRIRALEALQSGETRYRKLIHLMSNGFALHEIMTDETGTPVNYTFLNVNTAFEQMTGLSASSVVGKTVREVFPDTRSDSIETLGRVALTGEPIRIEISIEYLGKDFDLLAYSPEHGQFAAVFTDITERKRTETALQRYAQRLTVLREIDRGISIARPPDAIARKVLEQLHALIPCSYSTVMIFSSGLAEAKHFVLYTEDNSNRIRDFSSEVVPGELLERLKSGMSIVFDDVRRLPVDSVSPRIAEIIDLGMRSCLAVPLMAEEQLIGVLGLSSPEAEFFSPEHEEIAWEIGNQLSTAINQARLHEQIRLHSLELEERVLERTARLETRTRELEDFTYSVSHSLKSPLRGIDGYSRLLLTDHADNLSEEAHEFLQAIRRGTRQMHQLIEDTLTFSRLQRHKTTAHPIDIREIAETVVDGYREEINARGVSVDLTLPDMIACADRHELIIVIRNFLENALKFTRDTAAPAIEIGGRETEDSCILWVKDNGIGFDMKFHDRIFDMFQRLHRPEEYTGTGIGLVIVKKAAEKMGGRAWAESAISKGATFFIEIPGKP